MSCCTVCLPAAQLQTADYAGQLSVIISSTWLVSAKMPSRIASLLVVPVLAALMLAQLAAGRHLPLALAADQTDLDDALLSVQAPATPATSARRLRAADQSLPPLTDLRNHTPPPLSAQTDSPPPAVTAKQHPPPPSNKSGTLCFDLVLSVHAIA